MILKAFWIIDFERILKVFDEVFDRFGILEGFGTLEGFAVGPGEVLKGFGRIWGGIWRDFDGFGR